MLVMNESTTYSRRGYGRESPRSKSAMGGSDRASKREPPTVWSRLSQWSRVRLGECAHCMPPKSKPPWGTAGCAKANWFALASIAGARFWSSSSSSPKYSSMILTALS